MKILTEAVKLNKDFSGHCIQQDKFLKFEFIFYRNLWIFKHSSIKTQIFALLAILARYCKIVNPSIIAWLLGLILIVLIELVNKDLCEINCKITNINDTCVVFFL